MILIVFIFQIETNSTGQTSGENKYTEKNNMQTLEEMKQAFAVMVANLPKEKFKKVTEVFGVSTNVFD